MIKTVHINKCPILDGYGVMGIFQFPYTPSCEPCLTEPAGGCCTQLGGLSFALQALFLPPDSRSSQSSGSLCCGWRWHFRKISIKHRSIQIKCNFTKLTLYLYFKCIMYYAGFLFCSVYCQQSLPFILSFKRSLLRNRPKSDTCLYELFLITKT